MASLYRRGEKYWVAFYLNGELVRKSLRTTDERVAKTRLKQIEYELARGEYEPLSKLPLPEVLEAFCEHLRAKWTYRSYLGMLSRLRNFFGPITSSLEIRPAGPKDGRHLEMRSVSSEPSWSR